LSDEGSEGRREYAVTFIQAGYVRRRDGQDSNWRIPAETIQKATPLLDGVASFVDHADWFAQPSMRDLAGVTFSPSYNHQAQQVEGGLRLYDRPDLEWLGLVLDQILDDLENGREVPDVGLSLSFFARHEYIDVGEEPGLEYERVTTEITHVESCDIVFGPGAEGRFREILSSAGADVRVPAWLQKGVMPQEVLGTMDPEEVVEESGSQESGNQGSGNQGSGDSVPQEQVAVAAAPAPAPAPTNGTDQAVAALSAQVGQMSQEISRLTGLLADQAEGSAVHGMGVAPRGPQISMGRTSLEQVQAALEALISGRRPPAGVQPLTGIREFYHLMSGDYNMTGLFDAEHVYLANVNSSTMAGLVANALNKVVINLYQEYPQWWLPAVTIQDFNSLQDVRWITLGGIGELPTVSPGAAYTELTWDDQTETDSFVKKGGYLGLTLEAIDKDDTGRLMAAPRALAQGAWLTLGKAIAAIFTANSDVGPTMSDSIALFNASHSNLGSSALSWPAWEATKVAMMKQTELNSSERLGALTRPYLLWVPIDLETTALQTLASEGEPGTGDNDTNPNAEGNDHDTRLANARRRLVVCPLWTSTTNWAAQADPRLYPSIGLGFRFGHEPEIFSVASPTAGLMFTNDTLPIKVRFYFAVGPTDWRGLYKQNVS
jgi:hypothetical protein